MPKRNYKKEYKTFHGKPKQRKLNNMRHRARYNLKLKPGDAREVDHKKPLSKGGSNSRKNIRLVSKKTNRKKAAK